MTYKKIISLLIILSLTTPMFVGAQGFIGPIPLIPTDQIPPIPTSDSALRTKEVGVTVFGYTIPGFSFDTITIFIVKLAISAIVDSTVTWINGGFNGNPAFISDPQKYFGDIADSIAGNYINSSDVSFLCSPMQNNLRTSLRLSYANMKGQTSRNSSQCTLTGIGNNINDFYNDFSKGGWDSWFQLTQTPSYNPYSGYIEAESELTRRLNSTIQGQSSKLDWGKGFLSVPGDCLDFGDIGGGLDGCRRYAPNKTPGTTVEAQLEKVLGTGLGQLELADEFDELIGALMGQLVQKVVFGGIGLVTSGNTKPYSTKGDSTSVGGGQATPESQASCYASPEAVIVGDEVTWTAMTSLGDESTYLWSGEGLDGATTDTVKVRYTGAGIKNASLTVTAPAIIDETDGSVITPERTVPVGCRNTVRVSLYAPLQVKCQPGNDSLTAKRGETVRWVATISGGTAGSSGNFAQFIWSGDENRVDGETRNAWNIFPAVKNIASSTTTVIQPRYYDKTGNKTANLTVVDNDNSVQAVYQQRCDGSIYIYD